MSIFSIFLVLCLINCKVATATSDDHGLHTLIWQFVMQSLCNFDASMQWKRVIVVLEPCLCFLEYIVSLNSIHVCNATNDFQEYYCWWGGSIAIDFWPSKLGYKLEVRWLWYLSNHKTIWICGTGELLARLKLMI